MPPHYATPGEGEFVPGGGPISDEEGVQLQRWVQDGAPEGEPTTPIETVPIKSWRLGPPDAVLTLPKFADVPEEGRPYWQATVIPLGSYSGRKLRGFDIVVDQPKVLRSAVVAVARPGLLGTKRAREGFQTGGSLDLDAKTYLGSWAPGYPAWELPKGVSMTLSGDAIVVQFLVIPRGKTESGEFKIGLYFSHGMSDTEGLWTTLSEEEFAIPAPGSLVLSPKGQLPPASQVIAVYPEARFFCTSVRLWSGDKELFATRKWEPYWQGVYRYSNPLAFPEGAGLRSEFNFDNDIHMGRNEGRRPRPIMAGYRERDELCRIHVLYSRTR
jgi:hypothetical protein